MEISILHLDRELAVCVKPQGVPSQPDQSGSADMLTLLSRELISRGESGELYPVHRLDRVTGGLIVFARTRRAASELSRIIAEHGDFEKTYLAAVSGAPACERGEMRDLIFRDGMQKKAFIVTTERRGAQPALLDYELLDRSEHDGVGISLLRVHLHTGRFHQIRVQLASRGMSIIGDGKYGSRIKAESIALWAVSLSFTYRGRTYSFECEPPCDTFPWTKFTQ